MALKVFITSRQERIFDGTCNSVTSYNDVGEFDILDHHANFISLIKKYVIIDKGAPNELRTAISSGVMKCANNNVEVFIQLPT